MIYNEEAYYTGYYRNVRALGAIPALVFDTICGLLRTNESGEIANSTLCDLLGCTKPTLLNAIDKIIAAGYVTKTETVGRGNKPVYVLTEKGKENCPFMDDKRSKNFTEKVKKFYGKGKEILPLNKELKKELKESDGAMREAHTTPLSDTTPQNFENMESFNLFWELYCGDVNWEHERENCERVWFAMQQDWRDRLIEQLRKGQRWRVRDNDNPYWYLKNYNGETVQAELPYLRQGTVKFENWHRENVAKGNRMCLLLFEERVAYCLASDLPVMIDAGAKLLNGDWK